MCTAWQSSTSTSEDCPEKDDYDQTLMELGEWQPFGVHVDQPVEAAMGSGAALEDADSGAIRVIMDGSLGAAFGSGTASEDASSETGSQDQDQSSSPPSFSHAPPQQYSNFGLCLHQFNFGRMNFDCKV